MTEDSVKEIKADTDISDYAKVKKLLVNLLKARYGDDISFEDLCLGWQEGLNDLETWQKASIYFAMNQIVQEIVGQENMEDIQDYILLGDEPAFDCAELN